MYVLNETGEEFKRIDARCKELVAELLTLSGLTGTKVKISSSQDVYSFPARTGKLYLLKDGALTYARQHKALFFFDTGDLVGVEHLLTNANAKVLSDFAVVTEEYDGRALLERVMASPQLFKVWTEYLTLQWSMLASLCGEIMSNNPESPPEIRGFQAGELIISQGSPGTEVFTLMEGEADAVVNDVTVGEVLVGELFGVIAALTGIPRTASIRARSQCLVLVMPRENFIQVIESRPATVLKMVEDMARTLVAMNEQVVGLSLSKF